MDFPAIELPPIFVILSLLLPLPSFISAENSCCFKHQFFTNSCLFIEGMVCFEANCLIKTRTCICISYLVDLLKSFLVSY